MKSKFYKNPEAPFSLGLTYLCPSCKTEIVENENKILINENDFKKLKPIKEHINFSLKN